MMRWLAIHWPDLAMNWLEQAGCRPEALAVTVLHEQRKVVGSINQAAVRLGVVVGESWRAASARVPSLQEIRHESLPLGAVLDDLATACLAWTPTVCVGQRDTLLLDLDGCLMIHRGWPGLRAKLDHWLDDLGWRGVYVLAPTPRAAEWLVWQSAHRTVAVRHTQEMAVVALEDLPAALALVPVTVLGLPESALSLLRQWGLDTLGACLKMPRAALTQRLGSSLWQLWAQALGEQPDPRQPHRPPEQFAQWLELPAETHDVQALLFGAQRLVRALCRVLQGRGCGVRQMVWLFAHRRADATRLEVSLLQASDQPEVLLGVLQLQLERLPLPGAVYGMTLQADAWLVMERRSGDLLGRDRAPLELFVVWLERMRARWGDQAVCGLACQDSHVPEHASRPVAAHVLGAADVIGFGAASRHAAQSDGSAAPAVCRWGEASTAHRAPMPRPAWLLEVPQRLHLQGGKFRAPAGLRMLYGPERIESAWWDRAAARDYFVAVDQRGMRYWLYRTADQHWFLHGLFG